ncbi:hypothetical protein SUDANB176_00313 [Streptomyces sp. enrichment culture]|uniref:hypothetical protein n=1 Tax=Streptomyces sp. enrichment culture TaxID=1795815 RepID=UPI003F545FDB
MRHDETTGKVQALAHPPGRVRPTGSLPDRLIDTSHQVIVNGPSYRSDKRPTAPAAKPSTSQAGPLAACEKVIRVAGSWTFSDGTVPASPAVALAVLRERIAAGHLETWLTSSHGRSVAVITNTERAMVMLLDDEADPGEHAVTPEAAGRSKGFVLADGQHDEYLDEDTVPPAEALRIVDHILRAGAPRGDTTWSVDR